MPTTCTSIKGHTQILWALLEYRQVGIKSSLYVATLHKGKDLIWVLTAKSQGSTPLELWISLHVLIYASSNENYLFSWPYLSVFVITDLILFLMAFCMGSGGPYSFSIEIARSRSKFFCIRRDLTLLVFISATWSIYSNWQTLQRLIYIWQD